MADQTGLKYIGMMFATITLAVVLAAGFVVKGHADGRYMMDENASGAAISEAVN